MAIAPSPTNYGADASGLICGFHFGAEGRGISIDADAALPLLQGLEAGGEAGFVWLHFNLAQAATERWLREHLQLSDIFYESLTDGSRSSRVELDDEVLIAVLNDVHYHFAYDPSDISTLWLTVGQHLVVSARLHPLRSIDRLRDAVKKGALLQSSVDLLVHLMHDQGDVLVRIVRDTTAKVDEIEDKLLAGRLETKRVGLGALRRLLVRLQRLLAPEPAAMFRLLRTPPPWVREEDLEAVRQSTEEFDVVLNDMEALQERIKLHQDEIAASVAEANNRSLFVLTIVTVLALPINIITGLFGMNVGNVPFSNHPFGFWVVVGIIAAITAILGWIAFRKTRE